MKEIITKSPSGHHDAAVLFLPSSPQFHLSWSLPPWQVDQLREELAKRGLDTTGKKDVLAERLQVSASLSRVVGGGCFGILLMSTYQLL